MLAGNPVTARRDRYGDEQQAGKRGRTPGDRREQISIGPKHHRADTTGRRTGGSVEAPIAGARS